MTLERGNDEVEFGTVRDKMNKLTLQIGKNEKLNWEHRKRQKMNKSQVSDRK